MCIKAFHCVKRDKNIKLYINVMDKAHIHVANFYITCEFNSVGDWFYEILMELVQQSYMRQNVFHGGVVIADKGM